MTLSRRRIRSIVRKEFREYRRNRSVIVTMAIFPLIFLIQPVVARDSPVGVDVGGPRRHAHPVVHARDPGVHAGDAGGLCGRRRAHAGHSRAGPDDPDPTGGVPRGQGAGRARAVDRRGLPGLRGVPGLDARLDPAGGRSRRSSNRRTSWRSSCSRRSWPASSRGSGSRSRRDRRDVRVAQQLSLLGSIPAVAVIVAHRVRRDHADAPSRDHRGGRTPGRRHRRLADRRADVRPRAAGHRVALTVPDGLLAFATPEFQAHRTGCAPTPIEPQVGDDRLAGRCR